MIQKVVNFDGVIKKETKEHNRNWPQIPDHLYRMLIVGGSGSEKKNASLNKAPTSNWQNIFVCQRSIWSKIWITN